MISWRRSKALSDCRVTAAEIPSDATDRSLRALQSLFNDCPLPDRWGMTIIRGDCIKDMGQLRGPHENCEEGET
jgi:hypothetical protein